MVEVLCILLHLCNAIPVGVNCDENGNDLGQGCVFFQNVNGSSHFDQLIGTNIRTECEAKVKQCVLSPANEANRCPPVHESAAQQRSLAAVERTHLKSASVTGLPSASTSSQGPPRSALPTDCTSEFAARVIRVDGPDVFHCRWTADCSAMLCRELTLFLSLIALMIEIRQDTSARHRCQCKASPRHRLQKRDVALRTKLRVFRTHRSSYIHQ